ncbi:DoxX family protein [Candidatus Woesearchaeota archaeon]|nr:DoxX family protein [Candidatus Woesearchaeota archaeon]
MAVLTADWAPLALRLALGVIFIAHGYPKLKNVKSTAQWLASSGFKPGKFWALVLGFSEFFGGFALLIGFFSRLAAVALIISMSVATFLKIFKWKTPFTAMDKMGWEFDVLLLAALVALFLLGSGALSIDQLLGWKWG